MTKQVTVLALVLMAQAVPSQAQIYVSIGPNPIAPQGCLVCATISNDTANSITSFNACPMTVSTLAGVPVWAPNCPPTPFVIPPGQTLVAIWGQVDFNNSQVAQGFYRLNVTVPTLGIQQYVVQIGPPNEAAISPLGAHTLGTTRPLTICSPQSPNQQYIMAASLGQTPGIPLCPGVSVPLATDFLFFISLDPLNPFFQNFTGTLDATGHTVQGSDPTLVIPNVPAISNFQFTLAAVIIDVTNVVCPFKVTHPYVVSLL